MPAAEQAFQLAAGLPARERYFIEGSYYQMKGDLPRAIAAYEALIDEQPNDFWGHNNLALAYRLSGRFREDFEISKRLLLQRPNDATTLVNYGARLVINGEGLSDAVTLAARASTLERPPGLPGMIGAAWIELMPVFAAWADGRVADAAALLDRVSAVVPASEWHAFNRGQMNLALGRVKAAERAFQLMPDPAERETPPRIYGPGSWRHRWRSGDGSPAPHQHGLGRYRAKGPVRVITPCWALLRAGLSDAVPPGHRPIAVGRGTARLARRRTGGSRRRSRYGAAHAAGLVTRVPPGDNQYRSRHRRASPGSSSAAATLLAAAEVLRRLDGVHRMVYPRSGVHGFTWLVARTHLLDLERQLGRTDRVAALVQELEGWVAVADPDFVIRASLP